MESGYPHLPGPRRQYSTSSPGSDTLRRGANVKVNSICPGWVRTDMGGSEADRSIEESVPGIIWAATLPEDGPSGGFFRDGQALAW